MSSSFNNKKSNNNRRILVVDDEPDLILVFRTVLKEEGFEVDSFTDPN
jgi:CheY-like chemotaxis protein